MTYNTLHMGRSGFDLYIDDIGAAFVDITKFAAYVGGSPTNISVGAKRLGLNNALLTAIVRSLGHPAMDVDGDKVYDGLMRMYEQIARRVTEM